MSVCVLTAVYIDDTIFLNHTDDDDDEDDEDEDNWTSKRDTN